MVETIFHTNYNLIMLIILKVLKTSQTKNFIFFIMLK